MKRISFLTAILIVLLTAGAAYSSEPGWDKLYQKAQKLKTEEKYAESLKTYEELLKTVEIKFGKNNAKVAEVLTEMSLLYRYDFGNENKYAELQEKAQRIMLSLNGTVGCQSPKDWIYEQCRERWLGNDPCFVFRNAANYIKATYYGLDDSKFKKPDDFINHLKGLFGKFHAEDKVKIDGREAVRIKLRYEQGNRHDHDGMFIMPMFLYEEFLILPLKKGFLVFNLNLNHHTPLPSDFARENDSEELYSGAYDEYRIWLQFTESCKINPQLN
jgi:hypothetical protein